MKHSILIIDDEKNLAESLKRAIEKEQPDYFILSASTEEEVYDKIENMYFNVAIVDMRLDNFKDDGPEIIKRIIELNPFAKCIITSGYLPSYKKEITDLFSTGKIADIIEKKEPATYIKEILSSIKKIVDEFEDNTAINQKALETYYAEAKNEKDNFKKGQKFENFVSILFSQIGFVHINKRVKDKSLNEVDLIVRNEINDVFFQKFKPYFLIECKNTKEKIDKNQFIQFKTKLDNTNGLSDLGFFITSSAFKKNTYLEAIRDSSKNQKIIFISNIEINKLIKSSNLLETLKSIIDEQVKDN